ncbi:hypothetical protein Pcinc_013255, partial [Petrolisthes cinctipes]
VTTSKDVEDIRMFDDLLEYLGYGRWSVFIFIICGLCEAYLVAHTLGGAFSTPYLPHTCVYPQQLNTSTSAVIITPIDECVYNVTDNDGDGETRQMKCTEWLFDNSVFGTTLTQEMSLVCDRAYMAPLYTSIYMFGSVFGASIGGLLSDKIGRRPVLVWSLALFFIISCTSTFLYNIQIILTLRFCMGFLHAALLQSSYILALETTRIRARSLVGMMVVTPWALFMIIYGGAGYLFKHWRHVTLALTLPFLLLLLLCWYLDESARWLLVRGKVEEAQKAVVRASKWNRVQPPPLHTLNTIMANLHHKKEVRSTSTWDVLRQQVLSLFVLVRNKQLRTLTMVVCLNFFTASLVYFGLSLSAVNLSANPFVYMMVGGLVEMPPYLITGPILATLGRKKPATFNFCISGLILVVLPFVSKTAGGWVNITIAMLSKMCISSVFVELFLYSAEVFPTEIRIQGLGTGVFCSRFGSILSPFINDILTPLYPWMTSVVIGGLAVTAGIATHLLMPETLGNSLPDMVGDLEDDTTQPQQPPEQLSSPIVQIHQGQGQDKKPDQGNWSDTSITT